MLAPATFTRQTCIFWQKSPTDFRNFISTTLTFSFEQSYGAIAVPLTDDLPELSRRRRQLENHQAVITLIDTYATCLGSTSNGLPAPGTRHTATKPEEIFILLHSWRKGAESTVP
ncbi:hypothetical protein OH492_15545 [Vibrio chagasii]|nr:hypothetical protein [Vibrio chagasii]